MNELLRFVKTGHKVTMGYQKCTKKKSKSHSLFGLGAISDKLIFNKVVFVGNRAYGPMYKQFTAFR